MLWLRRGLIASRAVNKAFTRSTYGFDTMVKKHEYHESKSSKRMKREAKLNGTDNEVLIKDIESLLKYTDSTQQPSESSKDVPICKGGDRPVPERFSEVEVEISRLSSTGDGLGVSKSQDCVFVVPFTLPGDTALVRVDRYYPGAHYMTTDFIKILKPGPERDSELVKCRYFAKCAGCQLQMLPYDLQLKHKKTIVEKAYRNFSALTSEVIPHVEETIGSPEQYGYRTKLTPHFDGPPGAMSRSLRRDSSKRKALTEIPAIGFQEKGRNRTIDIEDCPIGTDAVREGMRIERARIAKNFGSYTKGATILLRESSERKAASDDADAKSTSTGASEIYEKTCVTDQRAMSTEFIDDFVFKNTAGAFFQNNNSILPTFTAYIRDRIVPANPSNDQNPMKYLIDAYCGSGLFTITLSSLFASSIGIDIAGASITAAKANALANQIDNATFMTADAAKLFEEVKFPPAETAVVIDPPRKGCDQAFLDQLLRFGPKRVVYVSCNVHTQARDVGVLVEGHGDCRYDIESLRGFDFFPQTGHVEGVAILSRSANVES